MDVPERAIVVGYDGSPDGERGLDWAIGEAVGRSLPLHVVYALPAQVSELPPTPAEYRSWLDGGERLLAAARERAAAGGARAVTTEVAERAVVPALIAAGRTASTIVVGARGHAPLYGFLIGSVSEHVARHAPCPVVVVRAPAHAGTARVVVGVDGSAGADRALGFAFEHAARTAAALVAVYGWRDSWTAPLAPGESHASYTVERIRAGSRLLERALTGWREKYPKVDVLTEAIPVHPARALADASEGAALVVVGARGRGEFAGMLLGSVGQSVLRQARCPVAIVH